MLECWNWRMSVISTILASLKWFWSPRFELNLTRNFGFRRAPFCSVKAEGGGATYPFFRWVCVSDDSKL